MRDPEAVIERAERKRAVVREYYGPALEWFLDNQGLDRRPAVVDALADHLDVDDAVARSVVSHLVTDAVDPVQQVTRPTEGRYVGVIDYAEHGWYYAFDRYDDGDGRQRSAVCAHCIHDDAVTDDVDAEHYTRQKSDYDRHRAEAALALHYEVAHAETPLSAAIRDVFEVPPVRIAQRAPDVDAVSQLTVSRVVRAVEALAADGDLAVADLDVDVPDTDVQPGAQLQSGTTINGNTAWHDGNVSGGTGISLNGQTIKTTGGGGGNIVERDIAGNAYVQYSTSVTTGIASLTKYGTALPSFSVANAYSVGFLDYSLNPSATNTVTKIADGNGNSVTPVRKGVVVTGVSAGEVFDFYVTATTTNSSITVSLTFEAGQYV